MNALKLRFRRQACLLLILCSLTSWLPAQTNPRRLPTHWQQLQAYLHRGQLLTAHLKNGEIKRGELRFGGTDKLTLTSGEEVSRDSLLWLRVELPPRSNLSQYHQLVRSGYSESVKALFSPAAPVGLVGVPAVTAYAVVTGPFCALGDLFGQHPKRRAQEYELLPDSK